MMKKTVRCSVCGKVFSSYNPRPQYCSAACKSKAQESDVDIEEAKRLYESGMTQVEVAFELHTTQKVIYNAFRRAGFKCRVAAKRNQYGRNNTSWKGKDAGYSSLHERLYRDRGKPCHCEVCGTSDPDKRYEWANVTGDYTDPNGYKRMCASCHRQFDHSEKGVKRNVK